MIDKMMQQQSGPQRPRKMGNFKGPGGNKKPQGEDGFQWLRIFRTLTFWSVIIFVALWLANQFGTQPEPEIEIEYSQFQTLMYSYAINSATIEGRELHGEIFSNAVDILDEQLQDTDLKLSAVRRKQALGLTDERVLVPRQLALENQLEKFEQLKPGLLEVLDEMEVLLKFSVLLSEPPSTSVAEKWSTYIKNFKFEPQSTQWTQLLLNLAPWVLMIGFWMFLMRRMQGGGGSNKGIFSFGKSKAKLISEDSIKVTFDDVAGADEAKQELQEIIEFLKEPEKFQRLGGKIPKGALLTGPPGTGKTLLAKAVAGEASVPFFSMSGADFVEMFVGVGASRVRDLFEQGKKNAPCIIFIDEIDAVGRHRGAGLGGGHDEREQTLNQLLVEMDGFESNEGVILIAATNRPDVLDHALLRPGRFDRQIVVDRPDVRGREGILKVHTKNINLAPDLDLGVIAKGTPGFSGADLANLVNEAALLAARKNKEKVGIDDLEEAKDKVLMGTERRSLLLSDEEKKNTAYHEAGHALMTKLIPGSDQVHKVTIIPRGQALGVTTTLPIDEKHTYSKTYCEANLGKLLGGRVAEKLIFHEFTTGAGNDITRATELARKMVCEWGMSENLGPLTFGRKQEEIFLGREIAQHRDYSERTAQLIDQEVKNFVMEAEKRVTQLMSDNIDKLHQIAQRLLVKEVIDSVDIDRIMNNEPLEEVADSSDEDTIEIKTEVKIPSDSSSPDSSSDDASVADTDE